MDSKTARLRYLDTSRIAAGIVAFQPTEELTSGSDQKALQAFRLVKSNFRRQFRCLMTPRDGGLMIECPGMTESTILRVCDIVEGKLARLRDQLLTAKMVEEILSITANELRHWTKDGRIPPHGRAFFRQGRKQVGLFVYLPAAIRQLTAQAGQIEQWRQQDQRRMAGQ